MTETLLTDREAGEDDGLVVTVHVPNHAPLNRHLDATDGTVAVTVSRSDGSEVTARLEHADIQGKATLLFRIASASGSIDDRDAEAIAAALSDELCPFVAVLLCDEDR